MENSQIRRRLDFNKGDDNENSFKQESKLTFNGFHIFYTNFDSYAFKQKEFLLDKKIFLQFAVIEWSKIYLYES